MEYNIDLRNILKEVLRFYHVDKYELLLMSSNPLHRKCRQMYFRLSHDLVYEKYDYFNGCNLKNIAKYIGMNHASNYTCLKAFKKHSENKEYMDEYLKIKALLI